MPITTRAAMIYETDRKWDLSQEHWKVEEVTLSDPGSNDVLVHLPFSGICHSDLHLLTGDMVPGMLPFIGGHEGAGVVEAVGSDVTHVKPGDHVVLSGIPSCGECLFCRKGQSMLCDTLAGIVAGPQLDGRFRFQNSKGQNCGQMCTVSTFAEYTIAPKTATVKIDKDIPLDKACIVGCGVTTGFGAATERAQVHVGDVVVVWGTGGVGMSAVQGAALAGAAEVIAVDLNDDKLELAQQLGATRTLNAQRDDIAAQVFEITEGVGADSTIMTVDYLTPTLIGDGYATIRRGGTLVLVGVAHPSVTTIAGVMPVDLAFNQKTITGCVLGGANAFVDIPRNLRLYQKGKLRLDEMITKVYPLEDVNQAFDDMLQGKNVRGLIRF
jgi:S-(hydroxymethyl)glutathione dehydrogenase/alcohol dehydrogenase